MAEQGFRKHSTVLFNGDNGYAARKWSGFLRDHTNLTNHQLCIMTSEVVESCSYAVHVIPDSDQATHSVDTGLRLDLSGKDSAIVTFTGVIRGLRLVADEVLDASIAVSAVLSSFSRTRRQDTRGDALGRYDYISSELSKASLVTGFSSLSKETPNHNNMAYHQLFLMADQILDDTYALRIIPDADINLSVDVGKTIDFAGTDSAMVYFGGIFRGIRLVNTTEFPSTNVPLKIILSSSVERFDEVVYEYIGDPPTSADLADHINNFSNPHQTSWDNLFNKPVRFFNNIRLTDAVVVEADEQFLIWEKLEIDGGSLEVQPGGKAIILHDRPEASATDPDFTYNVGGELTQIDYAGGEQKLFSYNGSGQLTQLDILKDGTTYRKSFFYTGGGELDYVTESWIFV